MKKSIVFVLLAWYFAGLVVYSVHYNNFVTQRQSGIAFELMTAMGLEPDNWQATVFFTHDNLQELWIRGVFPQPPDFNGLPVNMHAVWGSAEEKLQVLERYTSDPRYLPAVRWEGGSPLNGNETLTLIGRREEYVTHLSGGLHWTGRDGEEKYTPYSELVFTTEIYNIHNVWLLLHTLTPPGAEPDFLAAREQVREELLARASLLPQGRVNRDILFGGLKKVNARLPFSHRAGPKVNPVTELFRLVFVQWPTQPVKMLMFVPMFYVSYDSIGRVAEYYRVFLWAFGTGAVLFCIRYGKRPGK